MRSPPSKGEVRTSWFARLTLGALASVAAASLAAWLARFGWPFELFVHFRPQYAVAAVLLAEQVLGFQVASLGRRFELEHGADAVLAARLPGQQVAAQFGLYLDQAENLPVVAEFGRAREVLNGFAYTGAFALAALKGGATHVASIESSQPFIDRIARNVELNGLDATRSDPVNGDVFKVLRTYRDSRRTFRKRSSITSSQMRWTSSNFVKKRWPPMSNRKPLYATVRACPPTCWSCSSTTLDTPAFIRA